MDDKLREIIESKKDDREVAEFAGITLTLAEYDFLIEQAELSREWQLVATDRFNDWYKADQLNNRYKQALELVEDELEYAKTTGNNEVRDMYIKNSIRFINEVLEANT